MLSPNTPSTIGASFVTKRITDPDTATTVRLQIWDTAGQERFRSISRLYYRGANAGLLCYDVTSEKSWEEMKGWLREMRDQCSGNNGDIEDEPIIHVVGTKSDLVAEDPSLRQVPFERTIAYVAEQISGLPMSLMTESQSSTPPLTMRAATAALSQAAQSQVQQTLQSPDSKRSSGFWNQDLGWDSCHEVNAKDGEGIEEVFRVIARKLVDQRNRRDALAQARLGNANQRSESGDDYFSARPDGTNNHGSFRLTAGDKRKSWLGLPSVGLGIGEVSRDENGVGHASDEASEGQRRGRCC